MDTIGLEEVPRPVVYYPSHYDAFFAFSEDIDKPICFCSCEEKLYKKLMEEEGIYKAFVQIRQQAEKWRFV